MASKGKQSKPAAKPSPKPVPEKRVKATVQDQKVPPAPPIGEVIRRDTGKGNKKKS